MNKKNDLVKDIMQLSPEGEVNSGGYIVYLDVKRQSIYIHRSSQTLRGIVVLVFTTSDELKNASSISSSETFSLFGKQ